MKAIGLVVILGIWGLRGPASDGVDPLFSARQTLVGEWESFEKLALQPLRGQLELALFDQREEKVTSWPQGVLGVRVVTPQASWQDERSPGLWQKIQVLKSTNSLKLPDATGDKSVWRFVPFQLESRKLFWLSRQERMGEFEYVVDPAAFGVWDRLKVLLPAKGWLITQDYRIVFPMEYFGQTLESYPFQAEAPWEGEWQGKKLKTRAVFLGGTNLLFLHLQAPSGLPIKKLALLLGLGLTLVGLLWFIWWYRDQSKKSQSSLSLASLLPSTTSGSLSAGAVLGQVDPETVVTSSPPQVSSSAEHDILEQAEGGLSLLLKQLQLWQIDMDKYNVEWQSEDRILEKILSQWRLKPEQLHQNLGLFYPGREWLWPQDLLTRLIRLFFPQNIVSAHLLVQGLDEGEAQRLRVELVGEPAEWLKECLEWSHDLPKAWTIKWQYEPEEGKGRLVVGLVVRHRLLQGEAVIRATELLKDEFIDKMLEQLEEPMENESVLQAFSDNPLAQPHSYQRLSLDTSQLKRIKCVDLDRQDIQVRPPKEKTS